MREEPDETVIDADLFDELARTLDEADVAPVLSLLAKAQRRYEQVDES